jgi:diguanylate cyclase (GGDEF)-like protein/PAS domain S-box-containing protein
VSTQIDFERYRDFAICAADWVWEMDANLRFTWMSEHVEAYLRVPPEWHYGKSREDLLGPEYNRETWDAHLEDLKARRPFRDFTFYRLGDDTVPSIWIRTSGLPVFDENGVFQGYRGSAREATEDMVARTKAATLEHRLNEAISVLDDGFALYDANDALVLWNAAFCSINTQVSDMVASGVTFEALIRAAVTRGQLPEAVGQEEAWLAERLAQHRAGVTAAERQVSDGRWFMTRERPTAEGGVVGMWSDITARKRAQAAERASHERAQTLLDAIEKLNEMFVLWDENDQLVMCNARFRELNTAVIETTESGTPFETHVRAVLAAGLYPDAQGREDAWLEERLQRHQQPTGPFETQRQNGRWVLINEQKIGGTTATTSVDITEIKQTQRDLAFEKNRAEVTLRSIGDAVIATDANGAVTFMNPIAETLTGWSQADALSEPIERVCRLLNEGDREPVASPVAQCMADGAIANLESHTILVARDGREYFIRDSAAPIRAEGGLLDGVVLVFSDITERNRLARKASYDAGHDALTGLVNRRGFEARLQQALDAAHDNGISHALVYLDLDQFKVVNDTKGHAAGDELLRQLAIALQKPLRKRDTFARLGGDEFGILLEHCSLTQAHRVTEDIRAAIANYRFHWEGQPFQIGASMGLVSVDADSATIVELLRRADVACYAAKDAGRNRLHIYRENDSQLAKRRGEMQWVGWIQRALEEDRFELFQQPIAPLAATSLPSTDFRFEVLLRLRAEDGAIVAPGAFLPSAERYGLATQIDRWVIRQALLQLAAHPAFVERLARCAINLSGHSLADDAMADFIEGELTQAGIAPEKLCFEVTETAAIANLGAATELFGRLQALGCTFALDDFGSGLSSFAYLKSLPVDYLKIDGVFVKGIAGDPIDYAIVKSINELGQATGKRTIAEYAENDAVIDKLRELGVNYAQGYGIARPAPLSELLQ